MNKDICQRCGEGPDPDLRTLWMACFYAMDELPIPFDQVQIAGEIRKLKGFKDGPFPNMKMPVFSKKGVVDQKNFFQLRVCKECRADWMGAIENWFKEKRVVRSVGSGIFVRRNGATVEITQEEWDKENPNEEGRGGE